MATTVTTSTPHQSDSRAKPLARELSEWRFFVPFVGRVLALQGSHPTVAAGIYDHSEIFTNPWRRAMRTFVYAQRTLFDDDRAAAAREIRELHRDIKGTGFDGRPYHAWNREAWTWVHLTSTEAIFFSLEKIHGALPADRLQALYDDARLVGTWYGVREQDMPVDLAGLRAYVDEGIETRLTHRPVVELLRSLRSTPPPPGVPVPRPLWALSLWPAVHPLHIMLAGSFPETIRCRWHIRWTVLHELEYQAQLTALRTLTAPLPDRLRMLPYPYARLRQQGLAR